MDRDQGAAPSALSGVRRRALSALSTLSTFTRAVLLAKGAWPLGPGVCKQTAARGLGCQLLGGVGPRIAAIPVRPGVALPHHPLRNVLALQPQTGQRPPVIVDAADRHRHRPVQ